MDTLHRKFTTSLLSFLGIVVGDQTITNICKMRKLFGYISDSIYLTEDDEYSV